MSESGLEWEFKELEVPLDLSPIELAQDGAAQFDAIVSEHLARVRQDGWRPAEPIDFVALRAAGRLAGGIVRDFGGLSDYVSVTIRLKRQIRVVRP